MYVFSHEKCPSYIRWQSSFEICSMEIIYNTISTGNHNSCKSHMPSSCPLHFNNNEQQQNIAFSPKNEMQNFVHKYYDIRFIIVGAEAGKNRISSPSSSSKVTISYLLFGIFVCFFLSRGYHQSDEMQLTNRRKKRMEKWTVHSLLV